MNNANAQQTQNFVGRPPGAADAEKQFTTSLHTKVTRRSRVHDVLYNFKYFKKLSEDRNEPLDVTLERGVEAPSSTEMPNILLAAMVEKEIVLHSGFGQQSSLIADVVDDPTKLGLTEALLSRRTYNSVVGPIERESFRRRMEAAASTEDSITPGTLANPALELPLVRRDRKAEFSFGIEDVYANVVTTMLTNIEETYYENEDSDQTEMFLTQELTDIQTTSIKVSDDTNKMKKIAIGLRYSDEFAENNTRMEAVEMWREDVAIAARNALRNEGLRLIANNTRAGETIKAKTLTGGKSLSNLLRIDLEFGEAYPTNLLVMDIDTLAAWNAPAATQQVSQTIVQNQNPRMLLNTISANSSIGVTKENVWMTDTTDKILNYVTQITLQLYVRSMQFSMETIRDGQNQSYLTTITFRYVPVFRNRKGRMIWTVT